MMNMQLHHSAWLIALALLGCDGQQYVNPGTALLTVSHDVTGSKLVEGCNYVPVLRVGEMMRAVRQRFLAMPVRAGHFRPEAAVDRAATAAAHGRAMPTGSAGFASSGRCASYPQTTRVAGAARGCRLSGAKRRGPC